MIVDKVVVEFEGIRMFAGRLEESSEPRMYVEFRGIALDYLEEFVPLMQSMTEARRIYVQKIAERKFSPAALLKYIENKRKTASLVKKYNESLKTEAEVREMFNSTDIVGKPDIPFNSPEADKIAIECGKMIEVISPLDGKEE